MPRKKKIIAFKCTRADGTDYRTGKVNYAQALLKKKPIEILDAEPATGEVCGHGIHTSPTAIKTIQFAYKNYKPWRWFKGWFYEEDLIEKDNQKNRSKRFQPTKELYLEDIFGKDFLDRCKTVKEEAATWKDIPWLKPPGAVTKKQVQELVNEWIEALQPYLNGKKLPKKIKIITTAAAANADAAAANAAAADAAADAADADANAAAANANAAFSRNYYWRWYIRPRYVLCRYARWQIAGLQEANPFEPFTKLFKLGCLPIGYTKDGFVVYVPGYKGKGK